MFNWKSLLPVLLIAAGCTAAPPGPASSQELVWATGSITAAGPAAGVAELWNRQHPQGPRVRVEALPEAADDQRQLLALELNAGISDFDILDLDVIWTGEFASNGWLVELEDLREEVEQVALPGPVQSAVWDGRLWAAPYTTDAGLLYYRSDLIDRAALPTTWPQLMDLGQQIADREGIAGFVADGAQYEGLVVQYLEYLWGAGGDLFDTDCEILFDEAPAVQAAEFMQAALRDGFYAPGFETMGLEDAREAFQSGQAVFMRSWPYAWRLMNGADPTSQVAGNVGIAPLPTFPGGGATAGLGGHNLAVSAFSENAPAAVEFVRFVSTSPEVQRYLATQHSLAPAMASVYDELSSDPLMQQLDQVLPTAQPRPPTPEWSTISEEIQQQVFAAYTGDEDVRPTIAALREFLVATGARC